MDERSDDRDGRSPRAKRKCLVAADPSFWTSSLAHFSMWGYQVDAVVAAGLRDREEVEKLGRASEDKPWPHCPLPVSFTDRPLLASSSTGFLDTVPGGGGPSDPCNWQHPCALVAFLARCVVVNRVLTLSRDWLIQLSPKTTLFTVKPQIVPYFCPSAKKEQAG